MGFTKIVIVDNLANSSTKVLERIDEITKKGHMIVFEELDLREEEKLDSIFAKHGPFTSVIHFSFTKVGMIYLDAVIVQGGHEHILNNLEEGVIIVDEHSKEVQFINDAARALILQKVDDNETLFGLELSKSH